MWEITRGWMPGERGGDEKSMNDLVEDEVFVQ